MRKTDKKYTAVKNRIKPKSTKKGEYNDKTKKSNKK